MWGLGFRQCRHTGALYALRVPSIVLTCVGESGHFFGSCALLARDTPPPHLALRN
eukprot:COSAG02_NODE_1755_length_11052_cov_67.877842_4_plen_55_part_00